MTVRASGDSSRWCRGSSWRGWLRACPALFWLLLIPAAILAAYLCSRSQPQGTDESGGGGDAPVRNAIAPSPSERRPRNVSHAWIEAMAGREHFPSVTIPIDTSQSASFLVAANTPWRTADTRCGTSSDGRVFVGADGSTPATCDPDSAKPCCSKYGHCGITSDHCECATCVDYRIVEQIRIALTAAAEVESVPNKPSVTLRVSPPPPAGPVAWRLDARCGTSSSGEVFDAPDGTKPALCNPTSDKPCCSKYGYCGGTPDFCSCKGCVDYGPAEGEKKQSWREDGRCGEGFVAPDGSDPAICDKDSKRPCCSLLGRCGSSEFDCTCTGFTAPKKAGTCIDFRDQVSTLGIWDPKLPLDAPVEPELPAEVAACRRKLRMPGETMKPAARTRYAQRLQVNDRGKTISNTPTVLVLHETVGSASSTINFFQTARGRPASYHLMVDRRGRLIRFVADKYRAYGAGRSAFKGLEVATRRGTPSVNNVALHISLESPADGRGNVKKHSGYTEQQYRRTAQQMLIWQATYGLKRDRITTHKEVDRSGMRSDPRSFNWDMFHRYRTHAALTCGLEELV